MKERDNKRYYLRKKHKSKLTVGVEHVHVDLDLLLDWTNSDTKGSFQNVLICIYG
jgi:hypothetical protein